MALTPTRPLSYTAYEAVRGGAPVVVPDGDLQIRHMLAVLRRQRGTILLCTLAGLCIGAALGLLPHPKFAGTSLIELTKSSGSDPLGLQDLSGIGAELTGGEQMNSDLLTELTVISSDTTALTVLNRLHLQDTKPFAIPGAAKPDSILGRERGIPLEAAPLHRETALRTFHDNLKVEVVKGTRLISVTYRDRNPFQAANIANAIVNASIDAYTDARLQASGRASTWLTDQLSRLKRGVEDSQREVDDYQRQSGLAGLSMSTPGRSADGSSSVVFSNLPLERLLELNRDLTSAEVVRTEKEAIYHMAQTQDPAVVLGLGGTRLSEGTAVAPGSTDLQLLQELRGKQAQAEVRLATAQNKYGARNPAVIELETELASVKDQVAKELGRIQARTLDDLQLAQRNEDGLRRQVAVQQEQVARTGNVANRLILLQEQAQADRNLYQDLHTKLEEANAVSGIRGANISVVDVARVNTNPVSPQRWRMVGLGVLCGLVLGVAFAFIRSYMSDLLYDTGDVAALLPCRVLGVIPDFHASGRWRLPHLRWKRALALPAWDGASLLVIRDPHSTAAEAYRALRTALLESRNGTPPRSLVFLSGSPGEGRSTTCLNTAAAFATQGYRVLVVDADLRGPQRDWFGNGGGTGLSSCLQSGTSCTEAVHPCPGLANLSLLPAGPPVENPSELLGKERFRQLLEQLEDTFDFVFVDSPPALAVTDARVITRAVEGAVLVVRACQTTSHSLRQMTEWIANSPLPIGVCVNAAES